MDGIRIGQSVVVMGEPTPLVGTVERLNPPGHEHLEPTARVRLAVGPCVELATSNLVGVGRMGRMAHDD